MGKLFGSPSPTTGSSNASKSTKRPSSAGRGGARRSAHKTRPKQHQQPETSLLGDLILTTPVGQDSNFQDSMFASGDEQQQQPPQDLLAGLDLMGDSSSPHQHDNANSLSPQSGHLYHSNSMGVLSPQSSQHDLSSNGSQPMNLMDTDLMATNEVFLFSTFVFNSHLQNF